MKISVIIPAFNAARHLGQALHSASAQTLPAHEIIVVDDGSIDDTAAVARSFGSGVRLIQQNNAGVGPARNRGIAEATGDWIAFLDSDDLWHPRKLELQAALLAAHPSADLAFGRVRQFYSPELAVPEPARRKLEAENLWTVLPSSCVCRRAVFDRVGTFPSHLRLGEFIDWHNRVTEAGLLAVTVAEVLVERRIHTNNLGIRERQDRTDYARLAKEALDRRRAAAASRTASPTPTDHPPTESHG